MEGFQQKSLRNTLYKVCEVQAKENSLFCIPQPALQVFLRMHCAPLANTAHHQSLPHKLYTGCGNPLFLDAKGFRELLAKISHQSRDTLYKVCAVQAEENSLFCIPQPALQVYLRVYCTPSAYTPHHQPALHKLHKGCGNPLFLEAQGFREPANPWFSQD